MKPRIHHAFAPFIAITFCALTAGHAADVNTTGITSIINADNPGNRYLGNGILQISAGVDSLIELGTAGNSPFTEFAMTSGGLITIDTAVTLLNGGFAKGVWANNLADMTINGTLDLWDGNPARVNSLNGAGAITQGFQNTLLKDLFVGVDNGSGTFAGTIQGANGPTIIRILKNGSGTQTFTNLANQKPGQLVINSGLVELSSATAASMPTQILGTGNLLKSGLGGLTLTGGVMMGSGTTTVSAGSLGFGGDISAKSNFVAATGTSLGLNFTGISTVSSLNLGGSGPLPAGIYDSSNLTYGAFFTGTGQLNVLNGAIPMASGTWSSTTGGYWNVSSRWQSGVIANGSGNTATIGAATTITVTLDSNETLGNVAFQGANHTLNGATTLTLAGTTPGVSVATGTSSRIETLIAGTSGLTKTGAGILTLAVSNKTYTGATAANEGRLVLANILIPNSPNYAVASGATLDFNYTGTANRQLSGGTISGGGNLVKTGDGRLLLGASGARQNIALDSGALIDVQAGVIRGEFGNVSAGINGWLNNKADLNVASGAFFDIWDSNGIVDSISGAGTINKGWSSDSTLTFGVDNGSGAFSGTISQGTQVYGGAVGGTFGLIKNGTGVQTLSGSVNATGTVTINAGALLINGASPFNTGAVTVTGGALGGIGTLTGAVTVAAAGSLTPGNVGVGTLTLNSGLNIAAQAAGTGKLNFELDSIAASDRITVGTTLTLGTGVLGFGDFVFSPLVNLQNGIYTLISGATTLSGSLDPANLSGTIGAGPATGTLQLNGNNLQLVVTGMDPYLAWAGVGVPFTGDANNDGVQNGLAWFLGAADPNVNANGLLPVVTETGGALTMTFNMRNAASRGAAVLELQHSSDLGITDSWTGVVVPNTSITDISGVSFIIIPGTPPSDLNSVQATIPMSAAAGGKVFGRLKGIQ